jgi:hypothetical protein
VLRRLRPRATGRFYAAGVSLGGNALLCWLGQWQRQAEIVDAAAAVSAPLDLAQGGKALSSGANRLYTRMFLNTLKPKCLAKLEQFPGLFARDAMLAARDLHAFDNVVTAPLHGYRDADDYWHRASAKHVLRDITVPTLVLNAQNDPFLPGRYLPRSAAAASRSIIRAMAAMWALPPAAAGQPRLAAAAAAVHFEGGSAAPSSPQLSLTAALAENALWMISSQGPGQMAERAALLRLAGPGRARPLAHARPAAQQQQLPGDKIAQRPC